MTTRVASAAVLVPLVLALLVVGGPGWTLLVAFAAAIAADEAAGLFRHLGFAPTRWLAPAFAAAAVALSHWTGPAAIAATVVVLVPAAFLEQLLRPEERRSVRDWACHVATAAYVGPLLACLVLLRDAPAGLAWSLAALLLVWANDSAAYGVGRAIGRHRMAPVISPKKSWEGFAGGLAASVAVGAALPWLAGTTGLASLQGLATASALGVAALGLAISVVGPLGDLSKSFLKRQAGVKDAGHLIPGHGGVLDRVDSLMFAAPVAYVAALLAAGVRP